MAGLTLEQNSTIYLSRLISAGISTIGIAVIFVTYCFACIRYWRTKHTAKSHTSCSSSLSNSNYSEDKASKINFSHNIIFLISVSDLISCIATFIYPAPYEEQGNPSLCITQAFLFNFSEISTICLTTGLSCYIYFGTVYNKRFALAKNYFLWIILYGFVPAFLLSVIPLPMYKNEMNMSLYGLAGPWCWIRTIEKDTPDMKFNSMVYSIAIFGFNWVNILVNIYVIIKTIYFYQNSTKNISEKEVEQVQSLKQFCLFLLTFPSILVICWFFATLNRLYELLTREENVLYFFGTAIAMSGMGFFNSIVYFFVYFKDYYTCCKASRPLELSDKGSSLFLEQDANPHVEDDESNELKLSLRKNESI